MAKEKIKCNTCGCINNIDNIECEYCHFIIDPNKCIIKNKEERNIDFYIHQLKISVISNDLKMIDEYCKKINMMDKNNILSNYFSLNISDKIDFLMKNDNYNEDLDFIYHHDFLRIKMISKNKKLEVINNINDNEKKELLRLYINDNNEESKELKDDILKLDFNLPICKEIKKPLSKVYMIVCVITFILSIFISLICNYTIDLECLYAVIVAMDIIPAIIITIFLCRILKLKKIYVNIIFFLFIYFVLSYLMTIPYHDGAFFDSIGNHFNHIISAFYDITKVINSNGIPEVE